jgi:hemerythrin
MAIITWSDSYTVNSAPIDAQHKKLFGLINDLHDAMLQGKGKDILGTTLDALMDYTKVHFSAEEQMLEKLKYPELDVQKAEHAIFIKKITEMQTLQKTGKLVLTMPVLEFLKSWLSNHILKNDKKYSTYIR